MNKQASQPRAIYYVVALQIWEYFSFYGMRALLILYLTNQLKYDDNHAYELFSAYCSLVYVTPILGGYLADKVLGNRMAVMIGAFLMAVGHLVLGASEMAPAFLYLSLAIIVCGYGLFKSNISCLLGELYHLKIRVATVDSLCSTQPVTSVRSSHRLPADTCRKSTAGRWALRWLRLACWQGW